MSGAVNQPLFLGGISRGNLAKEKIVVGNFAFRDNRGSGIAHRLLIYKAQGCRAARGIGVIGGKMVAADIGEIQGVNSINFSPVFFLSEVAGSRSKRESRRRIFVRSITVIVLVNLLGLIDKESGAGRR